ncbi:MAG: TonB-dependent receptor [Acidobacteria bacterium]|nr:TonB-dependent receptor [Acidobacteriota bacterium]
MINESRLIFVSVILLLISRAVFAQVTTGVITGTAQDSTESVVPGVTVTITHVGTGLSRTALTDDRGDYSFPALAPGVYDVRAELSRFKVAIVKGVDLKVNQKMTVNLTLEVGELTEQVTVQAAALTTEAHSASLGQIIDRRKIVELPLNTRSYIQLAALAAGVSPKTPFRIDQFGDRNQFVNIDGGRESSTNYLIDGVETRSLRFNNSSLQPALDTIREFKVERNSFSAEFGHGSSVITVVTQSGMNDFHGTGYEFLRNDNLDARNFFDAKKLEFKRNQFGFAAGGPIIRNRTFVFGGYEGLRSSKGLTFLATVPDPKLLAGDLSPISTPIRDPLTGLPFPGNTIPESRIAKFSRLWRDQIPAPNRPGAALNFIRTASFLDDYDQVNVRVDHKFSTDSTMFARYSFSDWEQFNPAPLLGNITFGTLFPQDGQNLTIQHTYVFSPTLLNEFKLGYNRAIHFILQANPGDRNWVADLGLKNLAGGADPLNFGRPLVPIVGFSPVGEVPITQGAIENIYSVADNLTKVWGQHTTKFGFDIQHRRYHHVTEVPPRGNFVFTGFATGNSIADFLLGFPFQAFGAAGSSRSDYRSNYYGFFVQDDYKVSRRLTLNLGLRYENMTPWVEQDFKEAVFAPELGLIVYPKIPANMPPALRGLFLPEPGVRRGIIDHDWNDFAPRFGLAYRPFGSDDTVMRAGFGIFYDNINGNEFQFTRLIPPFYSTTVLISDARRPTLFTDELFPPLEQLERFPAPFSVIRSDRSPYTMQWNLNIQRKLGRDLLFEVGYAGSGGRKLWKRFNMNQADPDPTGTIPLRDRLPFPQFDPAMITSARDSLSSYNGLSIRVEKSYAQGFSFLAIPSRARLT